MVEYFDILDENGNKTGESKLRSEVHRDGDWHRAVHIWIINQNKEILLQRRSASKDNSPNMLDISCAGHLSSGDESLTCAIRELEEELGVYISPDELKFICTIQEADNDLESFVNNEFYDMYILKTDIKIQDTIIQEEELSEIMYVPYEKFKEMVINRQEDLVIYEEEFEVLFKLLDEESNK